MRTFASMTLWLLVLGAHAQLFTASNVPITVTTGTTVTVEGATRLDAGSNIVNQGVLRVEGDWVNFSGGTGFGPTSNGIVHLYGAAPQGIQGSNVTDFRNLRLTGGVKQLQQNAVVGLPAAPNGTLELGAGAVLSLENQTFTVFHPAGTAVIDNGGWVASESLSSRFQWALGADITEHRVPFGSPTGPAFPFAFTPAAPYPPNTLLSVATYATAPDNTPYPLTTDHQVLHMAGTATPDNSDQTVDRFWLVDLPNGSFTGDLLLSHTTTEDPAFGPGPIRGQRWLETAGTWQPPLPAQTNPGVREVRIPNVVFSDGIAPVNEHIWALAYESAPLPIRLISFDAVARDDRYVECIWTTASEQNNDHFTVERSKDGVVFEEVGTVPGAGNSQTTLHYVFDDLEPYSGLSYYRLRQTDFDGTRTWSEAVPVHFASAVDISVFPNPNSGRFTIHRSDAEEDAIFQLFDGAGRAIQQWTLFSGAERITVEVEQASGLYTLRWKDGQQKVSIVR